MRRRSTVARRRRGDGEGKSVKRGRESGRGRRLIVMRRRSIVVRRRRLLRADFLMFPNLRRRRSRSTKHNSKGLDRFSI